MSGALAGLGCEFQISAASYIDQTRLIAVHGEVVELGPLNPGRVGLPSDTPIAEPMPHDRFSFEAVVVDPDGERRPASALESIWFQCGAYNCDVAGFGAPPNPEYDRRCDEIELTEFGELTMDDRCRIGEGDGHFEFDIPELGPLLAQVRVTNYYGVIAWNGRSAEDCWATRRALDGLLDNCGFVIRSVKVGPSWWMLVYADQVLGIQTKIPIWQIPIAVYGQAANRTPQPSVEVWIDGKLDGTYPAKTQFGARPGALIGLTLVYDEFEQFSQTYFTAKSDADQEKYWFEPAAEFLTAVAHTTNTIHSTADVDVTQSFTQFEFIVDEYAGPGRSTIFLVNSDDRYAQGLIRLDFDIEVEP
jgi:hypothetical protein